MYTSYYINVTDFAKYRVSDDGYLVVDRTKDIPWNYSGGMLVPATAILDEELFSAFKFIRVVHSPTVNNHKIMMRLLVRWK